MKITMKDSKKKKKTDQSNPLRLKNGEFWLMDTNEDEIQLGEREVIIQNGAIDEMIDNIDKDNENFYAEEKTIIYKVIPVAVIKMKPIEEPFEVVSL